MPRRLRALAEPRLIDPSVHATSTKEEVPWGHELVCDFEAKAQIQTLLVSVEASRGFLCASGIQFGGWHLGSERALSTPLSPVFAAQNTGLHEESTFRPMFESAAQAILQMWNHVESRSLLHPKIRPKRIDRDSSPPYAGAIPR